MYKALKYFISATMILGLTFSLQSCQNKPSKSDYEKENERFFRDSGKKSTVKPLKDLP